MAKASSPSTTNWLDIVIQKNPFFEIEGKLFMPNTPIQDGRKRAGDSPVCGQYAPFNLIPLRTFPTRKEEKEKKERERERERERESKQCCGGGSLRAAGSINRPSLLFLPGE